MNYSKAQALGIRILLALGMLSVMAVAGVETPATVSAHGGDASMVHACVNDTNAETLIVHPGPGDATIDCVNAPWPLGAGWAPVDLTTWSGAGTGSLSPANLTDNVGIGTAAPATLLEVTQSAAGALGPTFTLRNGAGGLEHRLILTS